MFPYRASLWLLKNKMTRTTENDVITCETSL